MAKRRPIGKVLVYKSDWTIRAGQFVFDVGELPPGYHEMGIVAADGQRSVWFDRTGPKAITVRSKPFFEAGYIWLADGEVDRTEECVPGALFRDLASDGAVLGVEMLGQVTAQQLTKALQRA